MLLFNAHIYYVISLILFTSNKANKMACCILIGNDPHNNEIINDSMQHEYVNDICKCAYN